MFDGFISGVTVMQQQTGFGLHKTSIEDLQTKFGNIGRLAALAIQLERRRGGQSSLVI
jgi:hypothetical protein